MMMASTVPIFDLCSDGKFHLEIKCFAGLGEQVQKERRKATLNYVNEKKTQGTFQMGQDARQWYKMVLYSFQ